jgi:hypothetical protein
MAFHSSISGSYSTGAVSGANCVGGIAGGVQFSSSIENCYSTGAVNGSTQVGGIAGYVSSGSSSIENCAALNLSVTATSNTGRVAGSISDSNNTFTDNFAWDGMGTGGGGFTPGDDYNGALKAKTVFHSATGFPFDVTSDPWVYTTGRLPVLKGLAGQSNALPTHLE